MPILIQCPNPACAAASSAADSFAGRDVKCKKCGTPFKASPQTVDLQQAETKKSTPSSAGDPFPSLPAEFGRYRVLKLLGRGGMGAVYLAQDSQLGRQVALKLPSFDASETKRVERFVREARSAAGLMHPNICPVYDAGQVAGRPFITMAYIAGKSLEDGIDPDAPMDQRRAAEIARKVAAALHEAHDKGIVHRDLKPANVMLTAKGEPVVMDFGLAKRVAEVDPTEAKLTQDGAIMGTPSYMAPEQVKGDLASIGPATDVYALGVMLFEMLTGHVPYRGAIGMLLGQILAAPVRKPSELRPDVDPRLDDVCLRAMAKEPADRYPDMAAFEEALSQYLTGPTAVTASFVAPFEDLGYETVEEVEAPKKPRRPKEKTKTKVPEDEDEKPRSRLPLLLAAGAAAFLLVVAGVVLTVRTKHGDVVIELSDQPAGVEVKVDGARVDVTGLDKPLSLTAGEHGLSVVSPDFETVTTSFTVKKGEKQVVKVTLKPKAAVPKENPGEKTAQPSPPNDPTATAKSLFTQLKFDEAMPGLLAGTDPRWAEAASKDAAAAGTAAAALAAGDTWWALAGSLVGAEQVAARIRAVDSYIPGLQACEPVRRDEILRRIRSYSAAPDLTGRKPLAEPALAQMDKQMVDGMTATITGARLNIRRATAGGTGAEMIATDAVLPDAFVIKVRGRVTGGPADEWKIGIVNGKASYQLNFLNEGGSCYLFDPKSKPYGYSRTRWSVPHAHRPTGEFDEVTATVIADRLDVFLNGVPVAVDLPLVGKLGGAKLGLAVYKKSNGQPTTAEFEGVALYSAAGMEPRAERRRLVTDGGASDPGAAIGGSSPSQPNAAPGSPGPKAGGEFSPLFNGKDLTGWLVESGDAANWKVEDGAITVNANEPNRKESWLLSEKDYTDFIARFEFRTGPGAVNSGFAIRGLPGERPLVAGGKAVYAVPTHLQVEIFPESNDQNQPLPTGTVIGVGTANVKMKADPFGKQKPAGQWNEMEVELRGQKIKVRLNGALILDGNLDTLIAQGGNYPGLKRTAGRVGLQRWQGAVSFRNIRVRELPAAAEGFVPLFNGTDLTGWKAAGTPRWSWANGRLLAAPAPGGGAGLLLSDADFDDFEIELQYRLGAGAGSGLFLRADPTMQVSGGGQVEVQILDDEFPQFAKLPPSNKTGSVFNIFARNLAPPLNPGDWNAMRVRLEKRHIQVWVNDVRMIDSDFDAARDQFAAVPGLTRTTGRIGLQQKQKADVEFREVKVKRLTGARQSALPPAVPAETAAAVPLFNGADLSGWTAAGLPKWRWGNGRLLGSATADGAAGLLVTDAEYDDFEIELQYRHGAGANTGLLLRTERAPPVSGNGQIEVQIIDDEFPMYANVPAANKTGAVVGLFPRKAEPVLKRGDWNAVRVRLQKRQLGVWVNGEQTVDADLDTARDSFGTVPGLMRTTGHIALQQKQKADVEFRDVKVKRLAGK